MPRAVKVTLENVATIVEYGATLGFNLSYLKDQITYYAEFGWDTYLVSDGTVRDNNITFTVFSHEDFHRNWRFKEPVPLLQEIERNV